ncbi:MAG TPA: regulatory signaling modulator protein AmpE [Solimonas sp.]|nr:regulatory signaling modulator protein AmpE [Solimonas sp.]
MTLIGILIALGLERVLGHVPGWGRPVLFLGMVRALHRVLPGSFWRSPLLPPLLVLPPTLLAWWLPQQIENPILQLCVSAAVLLLCLGPRDLAEDISELLGARAAGDQERAGQLARALQRGPEPGETHRSLLGALFIQSHEKLFGVLLWYFVGDAAGAVAYRLVSRLPRFLGETAADAPAQHAADWLHSIMAWVPARVTAALYGLAGSLDDAMKEWRKLASLSLHAWRNQTWALLAEVSCASLRIEEQGGGEVVPGSLDAALQEVLRMQWRALLILLAFFAFFATGSIR